MLPSQSYSSQALTKSARQAFNTLADTMIYLKRSRELAKKVEEARDQAERRLVSLETFKVDVSDDITRLKGVLGESRAAELSRQVSGFTSTAVDQMKQKLNVEAQKEMSTLDSDLDSEKTKAVKSLEAFLSTSPLPLIDRSIEVDFQDAAYAASARYRCQDNIEYEFSLDTKMNPFFKAQCKLGALDRTLRIPVALGKSWLKKDPVPDLRSLEQYVVSKAEATETSLLVESADQEGQALVKIIYTRHGDHASLSVVYSNGAESVDVTSEPGLNAHMNSDSFVRVMERIWLAMNDLEKRKISVSKIICDNHSLLEDMTYNEFFLKCWQAISGPIKELLRLSSEKRVSSDESLDRPYVREKLKALGPESVEIADVIGVEV